MRQLAYAATFASSNLIGNVCTRILSGTISETQSTDGNFDWFLRMPIIMCTQRTARESHSIRTLCRYVIVLRVSRSKQCYLRFKYACLMKLSLRNAAYVVHS